MNLTAVMLLVLKTSIVLNVLAPGLGASFADPGIAAAISHANFPNQNLAVPAIVLYLIVSAIVSALVPRDASERGHRRTMSMSQEGKMAA